MMGRPGAEGGLVQDQAHLSAAAETTGRMDIYAQAVKALAVRSPFGSEDANGAGGAASAGGPLVRLPTGETKRKNRARKTQAVSNKRNFGDLDSAEVANPKLFWAQMEDYFREVTKEDIELLFPRTRLGLLDSMLPQDPCFVIRPLGCRYTDVWAEEDRKHRLQVELEAEAALEQSVRGVKRKLLTASPVSKKRKTNLVASSTTDVITSVISPPENAGEDLCHVCNGADSYEANQIVYCDSCNMAAHQECYGVRTVPDGQWLCSWCSAKASGEAGTTGVYCCVLCTVNGGALKPIAEAAAGPSGQKRFAHLVCCQWVPETYVENTEAVEPIKNIEGIREERWGLVCVICKLKHGACIQCSHGLCATAFHPLCARDAKYWMEVSSREDSQDVELRAYCQKHSFVKPAAAEISVNLDADKEKSPSEDAAIEFDDLKCFEDDEPAARVKVEDLPKCTISKAEEWTKEHSSSEELNDGGNDAGEFSARTGPCDSGEVNMEANSGEQTECESASVQPYVLPDILRRLRLLEQNASQRPLSAAGDAGEPPKGLEDVLGVGGHWEQLRRAKQSGLLDWSPQDELEAEIYILQNQLIDCAQGNLCSSEKLIAKVLSKLSTERQAARKIVQELTAVSQFISDLKEAKKLGRKERRDKEAQAVLAAATAAAAASPRTGYVKRDTGGNEDPYYDAAADGRSNWLLSNGNQQSPTARPVKPPLPRPPRLNISNSFRVSQTEKLSSRSNSQSQDEHLTCDVCSNTSSVRSNRILQCYRCKVVVHQDCYGVPRLPAGPWYCQPCSEVQRQQQSGAAASDAGPAAPQCALCPNKQGAFRRASDGRWVHVFCALWIPETTVGKEQTAAIGGLDAVPIERFNLICSVCQHQRGACVKCNFGHCYGAFHPICAREAGLYMSVKTIGGRTNYRAYCERHSSQQRAKADVKQYGSSEEMNALRQIRVEFERVRLICERISKRERIKRDLALCYKDLYITQLNLLALGGASQPAVEQSRKQAEANGSWYPSSEGVLLEGAADSKLLASEPGAGEVGPWGRRRVFGEHSSNGSKPKEGSQVEVPIRESKDHKKPRRCARHSEPLGREKVMTPSEASMHNKLLPKGYAYVPVDMLEKGIVAVKQEQQQAEQVDKKQELEQSSASSFLFTVVRELQRCTAQSSSASPASPLQHIVGG